MRVYYTLAVWRLKPFLSDRLFVFIWRFTVQKLLAVLVKFEEMSEKTKVVCGLGRTNCGGLRNARPPIIDPQIMAYSILRM